MGLHGSYRAYNDKTIFEKELERFIKTWKIRPVEGRQHFLRFSVPKTWQIWSETGMEEDSSLGFTSHAGFRTGTCYSYKVFDILQRKELT